MNKTLRCSKSIMPKKLAEWYYNKLTKGKVLDIGCCDGNFGKYKPSGFKVYGVDREQELICIANKYEKAIVGNAEKKIPYKDNVFDNVFARGVLEHITDRDKFMKEINRVLKVNGRLIITCEMPGDRFWIDPNHIRPFCNRSLFSLCTDYGFKVIKIYNSGDIPFLGIFGRQDLAHYISKIWGVSWLFPNVVVTAICEKESDEDADMC